MVECTLSITHCIRLNLQLHTIDLVRICRISSFCTVAWQLARFQLIRRIARSPAIAELLLLRYHNMMTKETCWSVHGAHKLNWTSVCEFANFTENSCIGIYALRTNRTLTVLVPLQPINRSTAVTLERVTTKRVVIWSVQISSVQFVCCKQASIRRPRKLGTLPGARRRGRPHTAWIDNIKTWTGLPVEESIRMAGDRDKWRKYVHGVANPRIEDGWRTEQNRLRRL